MEGLRGPGTVVPYPAYFGLLLVDVDLGEGVLGDEVLGCGEAAGAGADDGDGGDGEGERFGMGAHFRYLIILDEKRLRNKSGFRDWVWEKVVVICKKFASKAFAPSEVQMSPPWQRYLNREMTEPRLRWDKYLCSLLFCIHPF